MSESQVTECNTLDETSITMLILLMRCSKDRLRKVLFETHNKKILEDVRMAFRQVPDDFLSDSSMKIQEFRRKVNKMIMEEQKSSNNDKMEQVRQTMQCLKKIRKLN